MRSLDITSQSSEKLNPYIYIFLYTRIRTICFRIRKFEVTEIRNIYYVICVESMSTNSLTQKCIFENCDCTDTWGDPMLLENKSGLVTCVRCLPSFCFFASLNPHVRADSLHVLLRPVQFLSCAQHQYGFC